MPTIVGIVLVVVGVISISIFDRKGKNVKYEALFYSTLGQPYNPKGFEYGIRYLTERYQGIPLYITENGIGFRMNKMK